MDRFRHLFPNYERYDEKTLIQLAAEGNYIWTQHGQMLDMNSGYWNVPLGHGRPEVRQAAQNGYCAHPYHGTHPPMLDLAQKLCGRTGYDRVLFATSGSLAVDSALRIAWQCAMSKSAGFKQDVVALRKGFHGTTAAAHAASGFPERRSWVPNGFDTHLIDDWATKTETPDAERRLADQFIPWQRVSAFLFEPFQGTTGAKRLHPRAYRAIAERAHTSDALVIADEVTTGIGRTGLFLASEELSPRPDMVCLGKGLTNGEFPLSAVLMTDDVWQRIERSTDKLSIKYLHGYTYGAHPSGCLAALAVLDLVDEDMLLDVRNKGEMLGSALRWIAERHNAQVIDVRGRGLFWAIEVANRQLAENLEDELHTRGVRVGVEGRKLMFVPPYTVTLQQIMRSREALDSALTDLAASG